MSSFERTHKSWRLNLKNYLNFVCFTSVNSSKTGKLRQQATYYVYVFPPRNAVLKLPTADVTCARTTGTHDSHHGSMLHEPADVLQNLLPSDWGADLLKPEVVFLSDPLCPEVEAVRMWHAVYSEYVLYVTSSFVEECIVRTVANFGPLPWGSNEIFGKLFWLSNKNIFSNWRGV